MLEVIRQDYIMTARAKGLSERVVIYKHALRNALLPVITILGLSVPGLIGGSVIFETIFAIPGMGQLFYMAVMARDYPGRHGHSLHRRCSDAAGEPDCRCILRGGRSADPGVVRGMMGQDFLERFFKNKMAVAGSIVVMLLFAVSLLAPWIAPYDPNAIDLKHVLAPPSVGHPFGTDQLGRDVLSRMIWGARISLKVGFVATGIAMLIGTILGAAFRILRPLGRCGHHAVRGHHALLPYFFPHPGRDCDPRAVHLEHHDRHWPDRLDGHHAACPRRLHFPEGKGFRLRRHGSIGASDFRIIFLHILPNAMASVLVAATLGIAGAILTESALSFLGIGVQPPIPSWGNILTAGKDNIDIAWWLSLYPGLAILITVLGYNLLGEGIRDSLDPRLR